MPLVVHIGKKIRFNDQPPSSEGRQTEKGQSVSVSQNLSVYPAFQYYDIVYKFTIGISSFGLDVPL